MDSECAVILKFMTVLSVLAKHEHQNLTVYWIQSQTVDRGFSILVIVWEVLWYLVIVNYYNVIKSHAVTYCCELGNEPLDDVKGRQFLFYISSWKLSNKDSVHIMKTNKMHYFGQTYCPSSVSLHTVFTATNICHTSYVDWWPRWHTVNITIMTNAYCCEYSMKTADDGQ